MHFFFIAFFYIISELIYFILFFVRQGVIQGWLWTLHVIENWPSNLPPLASTQVLGLQMFTVTPSLHSGGDETQAVMHSRLLTEPQPQTTTSKAAVPALETINCVVCLSFGSWKSYFPLWNNPDGLLKLLKVFPFHRNLSSYTSQWKCRDTV